MKNEKEIREIIQALRMSKKEALEMNDLETARLFGFSVSILEWIVSNSKTLLKEQGHIRK